MYIYLYGCVYLYHNGSVSLKCFIQVPIDHMYIMYIHISIYPSLSIYIYMCVYVCMYIYIYMYIYMFVCVCVYIYIYIYIYTHMTARCAPSCTSRRARPHMRQLLGPVTSPPRASSPSSHSDPAEGRFCYGRPRGTLGTPLPRYGPPPTSSRLTTCCSSPRA